MQKEFDTYREASIDDINNDITVVTDVHDAIVKAVRLALSKQEKRAMAYNDWLMLDIAHELDNIYEENIKPVMEDLRKAFDNEYKKRN